MQSELCMFDFAQRFLIPFPSIPSILYHLAKQSNALGTLCAHTAYAMYGCLNLTSDRDKS